jgi:hypothetical protein
MNSNTQIISHFFLLSLAFGTQLFAPVVSTRLTGVGFYKLGSSIVLASLILAAGIQNFMAGSIDSLGFACYGFLLASHIFTSVAHKDNKTVLMWIFYILQLLVFIFFAFHLFLPLNGWPMFFFFSAALLGISNFAMILGHYYLVVPKLSEEPLIYCLFIFWAVLFLRLMSSLAVLLTNGMAYLEEGTALGDGYLYNWIFITMRYLWGYLAPGILSFFTFKLCKIRSIQSATGVLYIVEFFVIVGELISVYLMAKHGLSL